MVEPIKLELPSLRGNLVTTTISKKKNYPFYNITYSEDGSILRKKKDRIMFMSMSLDVFILHLKTNKNQFLCR